MVVWTEQRDLLTLKEAAAEGVLQHKLNTREKGSGWLAVANKLKANIPAVDVSGRSITDHFGMLARKHRIEMAKQEKETGGGERN